MSRLSTRPSTTRWKLAVLKSLDNGEVVVILKVVVPSISILPKVVTASVA